MPIRVLFLCTANSARSILFAATLDHFGQGRFQAHSAGSQPAGCVNPHALAELQRRGIGTAGARSKSWDEYTVPGAPAFDIVVTVCDNAAGEACPVFFGDFAQVHWGLPDPAAVQGSEHDREQAFRRTQDMVTERVQALVALPVEALDRPALEQALRAIDAAHPAGPVEGGA